MNELTTFLFTYFAEVWGILLEASPYVMFGFFVAGMLKGFMPKDFVSRHLGRRNGKRSAAPVFKAAFFGVPLPLCSCGVIPAAAGLRKQGASKGATTSFLISTPETGVDSMAITYALLDPIMTVIRPFAAFISAITAGLLVDNLPGMEEGQPEKNNAAKSAFDDGPTPLVVGKPLTYETITTSPQQATEACQSGCGCSGTPKQQPASIEAPGCCSSAPSKPEVSSCCSSSPAGQTIAEKFRHGMQFAYGDLISDIGKWLILGILLAAVITLFLPIDFIEKYVGNGLFGMGMMVLIGTPLYVCATASTPIAAALALKGLSPGAALVFLLAGPATNMATITVVAKTLGKKVAAVYVGTIAVVAVILGLLINQLYSSLGLSITQWIGTSEAHSHGPIAYISAVLLVSLITWQLGKKALQNSQQSHGGCNCQT